MRFRMIYVLIIGLLSSNGGFSQNTYWILTSDEKVDNSGFSKSMYNRLFIQLTDSTLSIFDFAKEEWDGKFNTTYSYDEQTKPYFDVKSDKGVLRCEYLTDTFLSIAISNEKYVFKKTETSKKKMADKSLEDFLDNNVFVSKLSWSKTDTIVFTKSDVKLSGPKNFTYKLIEIENQLLFNLDFEGGKLYPITKYSKSGFVLQRFDKDRSMISFMPIDKKRSDYSNKQNETIQFD